MRSSKELTELFFFDLKHFNNSNFKVLANADLSKQDAMVHKAFSSVITRYFIFKEKHPEVTEEEHKILYFKLKLDLVAAYFSEYPDTDLDNLIAFQLELRRYIKESKHRDSHTEENDEQTSSVPDLKLVTNNELPVEQQPKSVPVAL